MAGISSLGIGSGVLTSELVDKLVEVERAPTEKRLDADEELTNTEVSELGAIKELVSGFEVAVSALSLSSSFKTNTASSTNENAVTATATSIAEPGLFSVNVTQLAAKQTIATKTYTNLTDVVGEGTLTFNFGKVVTTLNPDKTVSSFDSFTADTTKAVTTLKVDATNHTLSGLRDAINAASLGVVATIVDTGSGFRLLIESGNTGEDNGFTITVSNATNGLDGLNFNASSVGANLLQTTTAADSNFSVNGLDIVRDTNAVTGVINGATLNLKQITTSAATVSIARDTAGITDKAQAFVDSYNELKTKINELTAFDAESGEGSLFIGDSTVRTLQFQMQRILVSAISSLSGGVFSSLADVGVSTNKDSGLLSLNSTTFSGLLASTDNINKLTTLFGVTGTATDSKINFLDNTLNTDPGDYDILITQLATQGKLVGNTTSGSFTIGNDNDTFKIKVNGTTSGTVTLTQGVYTGSNLASHLQAQINADSALKAVNGSVALSYDSVAQNFTFTSSNFGSSSSVSFDTLESTSANTLGIYTPGQGPRLLGTSTSLATVATLASGLTIDDTNDDFTLTVAGITSNSIELANAAYASGTALATALQSAINADAKFSANNIISTVSFVGDQGEGQLQISFNNDETFAIASADAGAATALGITTGEQVTSAVSGLAVADDFAAARVVDTTNDQFSLTVNGTTSNTIQIANASYTDGATLAAAVQAAINADGNLSGAGLSATVTFQGGNSSGGLKIDFGNSVTFTVASAEAAQQADLGISKSDGTEIVVPTGLDVAGKINGITAVGSGQALMGATGNVSEGLRVLVTGGPVGKRGTVSFVRGIADQLDRLLDSSLASGGAFSNKESTLQKTLTEISKERSALDERIETFRARLERQFTFNDIIVQQLQQTQSFLTTQFDILNATLTGRNS